MSHFKVIPVGDCVQRSTLAIPASTYKLFEKGIRARPDAIFMDLEDSVAPPDKVMARKNVIRALKELDWGRVRPMVRINGLDTEWFIRDLVEIVEQAGEYIDSFVVPMVGTASDVYTVDAILTQLEKSEGLTNIIGMEVIIETALAMSNVEEIAKESMTSQRLEALHFGVGDYAASTQSKTTNIGGIVDFYPYDQWHYAQARMVTAARAYGLRAIDGPFGSFHDKEGYTQACERAAALGMEGKWAIHPSQIKLAIDYFSPSEEEIADARAIIVAMEEAEKQGKGSASLNGKLIDIASIKMAEVVLSKVVDGEIS
jgi:citrate lyase subunit beta/citryl-CoA lyase